MGGREWASGNGDSQLPTREAPLAEANFGELGYGD